MNYKVEARLKDGKYLEKMKLIMAGPWIIAVKITRAGKTTRPILDRRPVKEEVKGADMNKTRLFVLPGILILLAAAFYFGLRVGGRSGPAPAAGEPGRSRAAPGLRRSTCGHLRRRSISRKSRG